MIGQLWDGDHDWFCVLAVPPLVGRDGGNVGTRVRVKVLLEELRLSGHDEGDDLTEAVVVDAEEPAKQGDGLEAKTWSEVEINLNKEDLIKMEIKNVIKYFDLSH